MPNYSGIWTEQAMMQAVAAGTWAGVPGAPTIGTATVLGATSVSVAFTAPAFLGLPAVITGYTVTSSPGGITATGATSPITVTGLTTGTPYTFTVTATNASGTGASSAASNSVTPVQINYIEDVFNTGLYSAAGGTETFSILGNVDMYAKGGLVWIKRRSGVASHFLLRPTLPSGGGISNSSNTTAANSNFGSSEFKVNSNNTVTMANGDINSGGSTYVSWNLAKQPKFFDVVTYTGNSTARTIAHNLGSAPGCIIVKKTNATSQWCVYHRGLTSAANGIFLNLTDAQTSDPALWNSTAPTSTVFSLGDSTGVNNSGDTYVAYLFAHDAGGFGLSGTDNVISCGSFTGSGAGVATTVTLGYEPQFIIAKRTDAAQNWIMFDNMRGFDNTNAARLFPNLSNAESTVPAENYFTPTATGFKYGPGNSMGDTANIIYIAIRRGPMKVPTSGTSVFEPVAYTGTGAAGQTLTGASFPPDLSIFQSRAGAGGAVGQFVDRLRGGTAYLPPSSTAAEGNTAGYYIRSFNMDGVTYGTSYIDYNANGTNYINWLMQRAPGFFDEVCYTGTGSATTVTHNLAAVPELMIVKQRSGAGNWRTYAASLGNTQQIVLNATDEAASAGAMWNSTTPTSTVFSLGNDSEVNGSGQTYVSYLFATCPGVSKVGSYTGTGGLQTINCGFAAGSRFVLIKRTDSTGDWYVYDSARGLSSSSDPYLFLNSTAAEVTGTNYVDTTSVGFQVTAAAPAGLNASGGTFIFLAIA
jgi:hypothetical protein